MTPGLRTAFKIALCVVAATLALAACSALPNLRLRSSVTPTPTATALPPTPTAPPPTPTATPTPSPQQLLQMAIAANANGEWETAAALAQQAREEDAALSDAATLILGESLLNAGQPAEVIAALADVRFADEASERKRLYWLASAYQQQTDWEHAIEMQAALLPLVPDLADYLHELNGDAYVQQDAPDLAVLEYEAALKAAPDGEQARLREKIADLLVESGEAESALVLYDELLKSATAPETLARLHYLQGLALREAGDEEEALAAFRRATEVTTSARESYLALVQLVNAGATVDDFRRGLINYSAGAYQAAIQAFEAHMRNAKKPRTAEALYYIGLSHRALERYDQALDSFEAAREASSDTIFQATVWMAQGRALEWAEEFEESRAAYREAQDVCPKCDSAPQALRRASDAALGMRDIAAAAGDLLWLQRNYPKDSGADDAMLRAAILYYADGRYAETAEVCLALLDRYPAAETARAAHFWLAKAKMQASERAEAREHLAAAAQTTELDYVAVRAAALLEGRDLTPRQPQNVLLQGDLAAERAECVAWLRQWAEGGAEYDFDALPDEMLEDTDYRRAEAFASLGLAEEAAASFRTLRRRLEEEPLPLFQLAERARELRLYSTSIAFAERVIALSPERSVLAAPRYLQRLAYPVDYADLVFAQAAQNGLDPLLLFALIRQESRFDARAGSWAGALGLMQVTPPTGEWIALQLRQAGFSKEDLFRPSLNVRFGTWYLARQLSDFGEALPAALAAYNGGPGRARLWLSQLPEYDPDLFVALIPIAETKLYATTIVEQWTVYTQIYMPGSATLPAADELPSP